MRRIAIGVAALLMACGGDAERTDDRGGAGAGSPGAAGVAGTAGSAGSAAAGSAGSTAVAGASAAGAGGHEAGGAGIAGASGGSAAGAPVIADAGANDARPITSADAAPITRPAIPGTVLWLESDVGVSAAGDKVSRWQDQSSAHNDAEQTTATLRPTLVANAWQGHPAVRFPGKPTAAFLRIKDAPSLNWGTGDWSIFVVASYKNALDGSHNGALGAFYGKFGKPEIFFCGNWPTSETVEKASLHIGLGEGFPGLESARRDLADSKVRVYAARRAGGRLELRVDGARDAQSGNAPGSVDSPGVDVFLGTFSANTPRLLAGDLLAVVAIQGATTTDDLAKLEGYLVKKYAPAP